MHLGRLAAVAGLDLSEEERDLLRTLSRYYIETRYPDVAGLDWEDGEKAKEYVAATRRLLDWLKTRMT